MSDDESKVPLPDLENSGEMQTLEDAGSLVEVAPTQRAPLGAHRHPQRNLPRVVDDARIPAKGVKSTPNRQQALLGQIGHVGVVGAHHRAHDADHRWGQGPKQAGHLFLIAPAGWLDQPGEGITTLLILCRMETAEKQLHPVIILVATKVRQ